MRVREILAGIVCAFAVAPLGFADPVTFSGNDSPDVRAAQVSFSISGSNLVVTLKNTAAAGSATAHNEVLTGVMWQYDDAPAPALTKVSALVQSPSGVYKYDSSTDSWGTITVPGDVVYYTGVPEPTGLALFAIGGLLLGRRRNRA